MRVKVQFRVNRVTGEVETFQVDHEGSRDSAADHDRKHEDIAAEIGRVLARFPGIDEISGAALPQTSSEATSEAPAEEESQNKRERRTQ